MPGTDEEKLAGVRTLMCYMMAHPGKKLIFMGSEFCQFAEWNYEKELEWFLLEYPFHRQAKAFFKALNYFYLETPALWQIDFSWEGFAWISNDDVTQSVISFRRIDKAGKEIIIVCNFLPVKREKYRIGIPEEGIYTEIFSSDRLEFGGKGITNGDTIRTQRVPMHGYEQSVSLTLPAMSVIFLKCRRRRPRRAKPDAALSGGTAVSRQTD